MPNNLSPELLKLLQAGSTANNSGWNPYSSINDGGLLYSPNVSRGTGMDNIGNDTMSGYVGYDPARDQPGDPYSNFDKEGKFTHDGTFQVGAKWSDALMPLLGAVGMAAFLPGGALGGMFGGGGAAAGSAADAFALSDAVYGGSGLSAGGGGAAMGAGGAAGFGTMAPYAVPAELTAAAAAPELSMFTPSFGGSAAAGAPLASAGGGGSASLTNGLNGSDIMSDAFTNSGSTGAGGFGGSASGGSWLDAIGGAKGALGLGASLLGGLAGAQGTPGQESTTTRDIPEWLKPHVNKTLNYAGGLLDQQMAPGYLSGYDKMRSVGQGLLSTPQRGSAFAQFFPNHQFGS